MTGLEEAFYTLGIIFMVIMLALVIALIIAIFAIRAKVNRIHDNIESKLNTLTFFAEKGGGLAAAAAGGVLRKAKGATSHKR